MNITVLRRLGCKIGYIDVCKLFVTSHENYAVEKDLSAHNLLISEEKDESTNICGYHCC